MEFTDVAPAPDCACGACTPIRRARRAPRPRAHLLAIAVGAGLSGTALAATATPAPAATLRAAAPAPTTRAEILQRADGWVNQHVPYSMRRHWSDGYRQDCSGFVSMAWGLPASETTWTLPRFAVRISASDLQPGDVLIYNNPHDPHGGSHAVLFAGWLNPGHTKYLAYEQTMPHTTKRSTPFPYWHHKGGYVPYRFRGVTDPQPADPQPTDPQPDAAEFPGADQFSLGQSNQYIQQLGEQLVRKGYGHSYLQGPSPDWSDADRQNVQQFQQDQGWTGTDADGYPGPDTWRLLFS